MILAHRQQSASARRWHYGLLAAFLLIFAIGASRITQPSEAAGVSIPDTAYAVPAGAIFMSPSGNDSGAGTQSAPVRTLNVAVAKTPIGGTIVMRAGLYRDWYASGATFGSLAKPLTIQPYPHEQVWLDGTDVVSSGWGNDGASHYTHTWSTPSFCGNNYYSRPWASQDATSANSGPCTHQDMQYGTAGDPQMVFINGQEQTEVASLAQVAPGTFYYSQDTVNKTGMLYLGTNPAGLTVEVAVRPMAIYAVANHVTVRGIGFRHFASNQYTSNATQAALFIDGADSIVENCAFYQNGGGGLTSSSAANFVARGNLLAENGFNGMNGNGSLSSGGVDNLVVEGNTFRNNNRLNFGGNGCNASCTQAGWKTAHVVGAVIRSNIFAQNTGNGWWCDLACSNIKFVHNLVYGNTKEGIFYEISDTGIIASNLVYNNGRGIAVGSANTKVYNNTVVGNGNGITIYDDDRTAGVGGWTNKQVGPDSVNDFVVNNIVSSTGQNDRCAKPVLLDICDAGQTTASQMMPGATNQDYNFYIRPSGAPTNLLAWYTAKATSTYYQSVAAVRSALGRELHSTDSSAQLAAVFANPATADYRLASSSPARGKGTVLPSDVAAAVGVPAGAPVDPGALSWPGQVIAATPQPTVSSTPKPTVASTPVKSATPPPGSGTPMPEVQPLAPTSGTVGVGGTVNLAGLAEGAQIQGITVDGQVLPAAKALDTTYLPNGTHQISITTIDPQTGKKTVVNQTIDVNNRLSWYESFRNALYLPFHGNLGMAYLVLSALGIVLLAGLSWVVLRLVCRGGAASIMNWLRHRHPARL